jgi:peroxiredoxin
MPYRALGLAVVLGLGAACATAVSAVQRGSPPRGQKACRALEKEYNDAVADYQKAVQKAKTDEEKKALADRHPRVGAFAARFMALARKYPDSPAAIDALFWVATHPVAPTDAQAGLRGDALTALARDHARSDKVGYLCTLLVFSVDPDTEEFLRGVLRRGNRVPVRSRACTSLAVNLKHRARLIPALKDNPDAVKQYELTYGKKAVRRLLDSDPARLRAESEELFQRVIDRYGARPHPTHGTLEKYARRHLLALRKPVDVDRVAPPITGEDVEGKKLRLADFKGSVVLLDFWSHAFAPCRDRFAYERGLVRRLAGQPFVLLGVNGDADRQAVRQTVDTEKITWQSFWDGDAYGPIATRWDVDVRPTLFLIDHKGVIRHFFAGWPDTKKLDETIDMLVREARKTP